MFLHGSSMIIVEDEPVIAQMIKDIAMDLGWSVSIAHSEQAAFEFLRSSRPAIAVLDINLGLGTSLGVAAVCRDHRIPVLFMTGYPLSQIPEGCGDSPVLSKPFSPVDFSAALQRCVGGTGSAAPTATAALPGPENAPE